MIPYIFYLAGSICFMIGALIAIPIFSLAGSICFVIGILIAISQL